jgi:hypothetical protein
MVQNQSVATVTQPRPSSFVIALTQGISQPDDACITPEELLDFAERLLGRLAVCAQAFQRLFWVRKDSFRRLIHHRPTTLPIAAT